MTGRTVVRLAFVAVGLVSLVSCGTAETPTPAPPTATLTPTPAPTATATPQPTATTAPSATPTALPSATTAVAPSKTPVPSIALPAPTAPPAASWQPGNADAVQRLSRYNNGTQGELVERLFYSPVLGQTMPYDIYLPPGYDTSDCRYPVLYMLHGGGGHRDEWPAYGFIDVADKEIREGRLQPMIIVFPQGDDGYWTDNADNGPRWGEYLWRDVVGHLDAAYRTLPSPVSRAIGGNSMGGYGALSNSFLHPDVFGVVGSHSASLPEDDGFRPVLGTGDFFKQKDPVTVATTAQGLEKLKIWIDISQEDTWLPRNNELHNALADRGVAHTWQVNPGVHDYTYWMAHTLDYFSFYAGSLAGQ